MKILPTYDLNSIRLLAERTEYEAWFLKEVYTIIDQNQCPSFSDSVIYPIDGSGPEFNNPGNFSIIVGDWRSGFLSAGAPLIFIVTFKLLDMFIEWVLEANGIKSTYHFQDKVKGLSLKPIFPALIESRIWLKERLAGLYVTLEPLRGTIIHDRHFTASDGVIRVSSSKGKVVGSQFEIGSEELTWLAYTVVSVLLYVNETWSLDQYREKILRCHLDSLASLHGFPSLGQRQPYHQTVRIFSKDPDPRNVDPSVISLDLEKRYPSKDCMFDLRFLTVKGGHVIDAFLFPWVLLEKGNAEWGKSINSDAYRISIPKDINPKHYKTGDSG